MKPDKLSTGWWIKLNFLILSLGCALYAIHYLNTKGLKKTAKSTNPPLSIQKQRTARLIVTPPVQNLDKDRQEP